MAKIQIKSITKKIMMLFTVSVVTSLTIFFTLFSVTNYLLDDIFQNSLFRKNVSVSLVDQFQIYVSENTLKTSDIEEIREWAQENNVVYFTISRENLLLYDNAYLGHVPLNNTASEQLNYTRLLVSNVHFFDGDADVVIYKNEERIYYFILYALAALISGLIGIIIVFGGIRKEVLYIVELNDEVNKMNTGLENASFRVVGEDEISSLAGAIEHMRVELIQKEKNEIEMKKAQDNLVLGMAHDLRTPLTSLITYIEIVKRQKTLSDVVTYSDIALKKAGEIKNLSDQMFDFFLIDSGEKDVFEIADVEFVFNDYLSEMCSYLESLGFTVEVIELSWPHQKVSVSYDYLDRIMNNIQSNIKAYADNTKPVYLETRSDGKYFYISVENTISENAHNNSSNGIGLKNINSMMKKMNGDCTIHENKQTFKIDLIIAML